MNADEELGLDPHGRPLWHGTRWPMPAEEPAEEPSDDHEGPLDELDDGRYLDPSDPRRLDAELARGAPFDEEPLAGRARHARRRDRGDS